MIAINPLTPETVHWLIAQHARVYVGELQWKAEFETIVAKEIEAFVAHFDEKADCFWLASVEGIPAASISVASVDDKTARIRFFVTDPTFQGRGLGKQLLQAALDFCATAQKDVYLTTVQGLDAAKHLYEQAGFVMTDEHVDASWGSTLMEQRWERRYAARNDAR